MIESGCHDLSEGRTLRASAVRNAADIHPLFPGIAAKNVAEFVNNSTLLGRHQQHQKGEKLDHVFHLENQLPYYSA